MCFHNYQQLPYENEQFDNHPILTGCWYLNQKQVIIKSIKNTLGVEGCFSVGELDGEDQSITIGTLGNYVGLIEYFTEDYVEVNVYEPRSTSSDAIDSYTLFYEDLEEDILGDVLLLCEEWEVQNIKTEKRISN